jgi:hypothetical protein
MIEPVIAQRPARPYVAIPAAVTMQTLGTAVPPLTGELFGWLTDVAREHGGLRGDPFAVYYGESQRGQRRTGRGLGSELLETDASDDPRLQELAEIMAGLAEQAHASGEIIPGEMAHDLAFDLLDALAVESDPRVERLLELMRERGWDGWIRMERLEPPG